MARNTEESEIEFEEDGDFTVTFTMRLPDQPAEDTDEEEA